MTHVLTVTFDQFNVSSVNKKYLKTKLLNVSVTIWNTSQLPRKQYKSTTGSWAVTSWPLNVSRHKLTLELEDWTSTKALSQMAP